MPITWLPMLGFTASARKLDDERLKRQVESCHWFIEQLDSSNPNLLEEVRMWAGYEMRFAIYAIAVVQEAVVKRRLDFDTKPFHDWAQELRSISMPNDPPPWLGDVDICRSHRSRLIALDPAYEDIFPNTPRNMPILWPQPVHPDMEPCGYRLRLKTDDIRRLSTGRRVLPDHLYYNPSKNEVLRRSS